MQQLYQCKSEDYLRDFQLQQFIKEMCDPSNANFLMLPSEDRACINLLIALIDDQDNLPELLAAESDPLEKIYLSIQKLNSYLSENQTHSVSDRLEEIDSNITSKPLRPSDKYLCENLLAEKCRKILTNNPALTNDSRNAYEEILSIYILYARLAQKNASPNQASATSLQTPELKAPPRNEGKTKFTSS